MGAAGSGVVGAWRGEVGDREGLEGVGGRTRTLPGREACAKLLSRGRGTVLGSTADAAAGPRPPGRRLGLAPEPPPWSRALHPAFPGPSREAKACGAQGPGLCGVAVPPPHSCAFPPGPDSGKPRAALPQLPPPRSAWALLGDPTSLTPRWVPGAYSEACNSGRDPGAGCGRTVCRKGSEHSEIINRGPREACGVCIVLGVRSLHYVL